jgi:protein gp37
MADKTAIEWTNATWNPVTGCTKVSPGCDNCYAERFSERFRGVPNHPFEHGFDLKLRPERLEQPLKWRKSKMIFVNSMSDLFHKDIPKSHIDQVFDTMERADWHVFQVLTKRSSLMKKYVNDRYGPDGEAPAHIWLGASVEDKRRKSRVKHIQDMRAAVRFLSLEPLIEGLGPLNLAGIHWVIVGGESGPGHRPIEEDWVLSIRDQCQAQSVAFFFKQWGGLRPKTGGRLLNNLEYSEFPEIAPLITSGNAGNEFIQTGWKIRSVGD